jgi:hypothetical protein
MGLSGQRHAPAALYSRERTPGTHYIGGWVGPRAGLDAEIRGKEAGYQHENNTVTIAKQFVFKIQKTVAGK